MMIIRLRIDLNFVSYIEVANTHRLSFKPLLKVEIVFFSVFFFLVINLKHDYIWRIVSYQSRNL
jgi:hypothetical protein